MKDIDKRIDFLRTISKRYGMTQVFNMSVECFHTYLDIIEDFCKLNNSDPMFFVSSNFEFRLEWNGEETSQVIECMTNKTLRVFKFKWNNEGCKFKSMYYIKNEL